MPWKFILLLNFSTNHNKAVLSLGEKFAIVQKFRSPEVRWYHGKSEGNKMFSTLKACNTKRAERFWGCWRKNCFFFLIAGFDYLFFLHLLFGFRMQLAEFFFITNASKAAILLKHPNFFLFQGFSIFSLFCQFFFMIIYLLFSMTLIKIPSA